MAFIPVKTYVISTTTTSQNINIPRTFNYAQPQLQIYTKDTETVYKFGANSSVVADDTVTNGALEDGNFILPKPSIVLYNLLPDQLYVAAKALTGTGTAYLTLGYNEDV